MALIVCNGGRCEIPEGNPDSSNTISVRLIFDREQLLYDIANMAYITAHTLSKEQQHLKHLIIDVKEDGNRDRVMRVLGLVHASICEALHPMTQEDIYEESLADREENPKEYVVELAVPADSSRTTIKALVHWIHELMVCRVLADWYTLLNTEFSALWYQKAEQAEDEINKIKNTRSSAMTRPCWPAT